MQVRVRIGVLRNWTLKNFVGRLNQVRSSIILILFVWFLQNVNKIAAGRFHPVSRTVYLRVEVTITEISQHTDD